MAAGNNRSNEIKLTRIYEAPVKVVWDAWADPEQVAKWWGPRGFTLTTHSKDLRAGGTWHYTMHGPDGKDYENKTKYLEVEKHSRLVYDHGGNDERAPLFRVTVTFKEVSKGKSLMEMIMALPTPEAAEEARKFIKNAGGDSTWDRLAEYLEKNATGQEKFFINRAFDAPIERVFDAWTRPEQVSNWLPPQGFKMDYIEVDIRTGGSSFYRMYNDAGLAFHGRAQYLEITRPHRIVYTQQFCDEKGNISRHPMAPTWPENMRTLVTFAEEGPGRTRVTIEWEPYGKVTSEEMAVFIAARAGMTGGWTGSFDKLEELLAR